MSMSSSISISNKTRPSMPPEPLDPAKLDFGRMCSPNFFVMDYRNGQWESARIQPVEPLRMHPTTSVLHYAQTIFEGLKAYRHDDGSIALFRPDLNANRFRVSAQRMMIPEIDETFFVEAVSALVENERHWVPAAPGCFYIRPTAMGVDEALGVRSASNFLFFILTLPSGQYFGGTGIGKGIDVYVAQSVVRSAPGLTGNVKAGANYGPTLQITDHAKHLGCAQVLFLDAIHRKYIEEMGGMNVMFVQKNTLRTPPLAGTILNGVTRSSLLQIGRDMGLGVSEEPITIDEVKAGAQDGTITEMMACGTAAVVMGIKNLKLEDGTTLTFSGDAPGQVTTALYEQLVGVQYGRRPDTHGWIKKVCRVETAAAAR
jgi:branched-chain amino acid aminotransferase